MATMTLLEMVQSIVNDLEADPVNQIDGTVEADQAASIIRDTYFELISQRDWPFTRKAGVLVAYGDLSNPTKMRYPLDCNKALVIKYNGAKITWMEPLEFKDMLDGRDTSASNVITGGFLNDRDPLYFTSYDDDVLWFDAYDSSSDSTLQASNSWIMYHHEPAWSHVSGFTPLLPAKMFPMLLADAKSTAFLALKQQANPKEESKARRGRARFQNEAWRTEAAEQTTNRNINYGRK